MISIKSQRCGYYGSHNHDEFHVMIKIAVWETQKSELTASFHIGRRATNSKPPTPQSISHY
jgi:hypothetical protein